MGSIDSISLSVDTTLVCFTGYRGALGLINQCIDVLYVSDYPLDHVLMYNVTV